MKKITGIAFFLLTSITSFAQQEVQQPLQRISNHDLAMQYMKKSKSQKTTSTVLLISGGTFLLTGMIITVASLGNAFDFSHPDKVASGIDVGGVLAISGTCILVTGIPFAFTARHNKKKAELLLRNEKVMPATSFNSGRVYSISIAIPF